MTYSTRFFLELIRIVAIFLLGGALLNTLIPLIFSTFGIEKMNIVLISIATLLLLFILYKNNLQFSGWYKSGDQKPLPKLVTKRYLSLRVFSYFLVSYKTYKKSGIQSCLNGLS